MGHPSTNNGAFHGSVKTYVTGSILSIILTVIPFRMVITEAVPPAVALGTVLAAAVAQTLVHLMCFPHMNIKSDKGWNMMTFAFTVLITVTLAAGPIWIMWNLNYDMMMH